VTAAKMRARLDIPYSLQMRKRVQRPRRWRRHLLADYPANGSAPYD
jgi:hypothetical protein